MTTKQIDSAAVSPAPLAGRTLRLVLVCLFLGECFYFLATRVDTFWSGGADLAHHIAAASFYMDVRSGSVVVFGGTPTYAHMLAAIVGSLFGSPVIGVQLVALSALLAIWVFIALAIGSLPAPLASLTLLGVYILAFVNERTLRFEIFGHEIFGNFFFAHIVAQAVAIAVVALTVRSEAAGHDPRWRYLLIAAAICLLVNIHVVPTLVICAFLVLTVLVDALLASPVVRLRRLVAGAVLAAGAFAFVLFNPGFIATARLAPLDGSLPLRVTPTAFSVLLLALVTGAISLGVLYRWARHDPDERRRLAFVRGVAVFGLAAAGVCVLQYVTFLMGLCAPYGVKKYAFSLNTTLFLFLVLLVARGLARWPRAWLLDVRTPSVLVAYAPLMVILFAPVHAHPLINVPRLIQVERFARAYRDLGVEAPPLGKDDYAVGIADIAAAGNYLVSIDALRTPIGENSIAILYHQPIPHPETARYFLTSPGAKPWDIADCRRFTADIQLVVLDAACVMARIPATTPAQ